MIPCIACTYKIAIIWRRCWRCWPVLPTRRDTLSRLHRRRSLVKLIKEITSIMSRNFVLSQLFSLLHSNIMCRWNHLSPNKNLYEQINYGCVDPIQSACSVMSYIATTETGPLGRNLSSQNVKWLRTIVGTTFHKQTDGDDASRWEL